MVDDRLISQANQLHGTALVELVIVTLVFALLLGIAVSWLFQKIDRIRSIEEERRSKNTPPRTLIIKQAALILALWLIWFVLRFPGNTDPDTEIELLEYYGLMQANNHHPWFDTMLFGVFWNIGNCLGSNWWSVGLWAAFQSIATALALSTSIWYARYVGIKSHYAWIASVFVGVMPIYPTLAQTMAKDMIFGWLWVLYALLYTETLRTRGALFNRRWAIAALIGLGICLALTKKTGIYLLIVTSILSICVNRFARLQQLSALVAIALFYYVIWSAIILPSWNIEPGNDEQEMQSIPSQQTALIIRNKAANLTEADWALLNEVYDDPESMAADYNPLRSDGTKQHYRQGIPTSTKLAYLAWMAQCVVRFPDAFFAAPLATCYPLFGVDSWIEFGGKERLGVMFIYEYTGVAPDGNERIIQQWADWSSGLSTPEEVKEVLKGAFRTSEQQRLTDTADGVYLALADWLPILLSKALWLTWIPAFIIAYLLRKKDICGLLALAPHVLVYATLLIGPIVLTRYCTATIYSLPLMLTLLFAPSLAQTRKRQNLTTRARQH